VTPEQPPAVNIETPVSERQSSAWDISNAPRNYVSLVAYQVLSAAFSFATVWLITRHLGSEGYGGIIAIIAASQVAQVFVNWTSTAVVRFGVDEFIDTQMISRTFWVRLIALIVNLLVVILFSRLWFPTLADWLKLSPETFWLVIAHFAVTVVWIHVQMSLQAAKLPRIQGFLQMTERLLIFAGIFALTAAANLKPFEAMLCYIIAPAAMILAGMFKLRHFISARFDMDRAFIHKIVAYSAPLLPFSLVGYFAGSYVDAVFISKFLSTSELGIYSVATQINGIALQLPTLANTLLLPMFVTLLKEAGHERLQNYFRNVLPSVALLWGVACTVLAFVAHALIPLVFGSEFAPSVLPLWILLSASVVAIPVTIGYAALSNANSTTYISMWSAVLAAAVNIVGNVILIPRYGISGCAWATFASFLISVVTFSILVRRVEKIPFSWGPWAILPSLSAVVVYSFFDAPLTALLICLAVSALVACFEKSSVKETLRFLKNLRARH
jgi:O-antigen/teichoic acid export membrane protein